MKPKVESESFRALAALSYFGRIATFGNLSCKEMLFSDVQTSPDTQKQHFRV